MNMLDVCIIPRQLSLKDVHKMGYKVTLILTEYFIFIRRSAPLEPDKGKKVGFFQLVSCYAICEPLSIS